MNAIKVDCSNGLLTTDIALLAVDETHAVFSIRIERAKLAENHFFLNVVSDIAGRQRRAECAATRHGSEKPVVRGSCGMGLGELD